jgi:hypothetical protein
VSDLFLERLESAEGESRFVIGINLDIRGFSDWCRDPAQSALYLKKLYAGLYADYFSAASMVKPTGDGLMVVIVTTEEDLEDLVVKTVADAKEIINSFGELTKAAKMINFDVPDQVGIGISRGSAVRLVAEDVTLDYSGRVLNVASRLMDLARPAGLVLDQGFGTDLLPTELADDLVEQEVFLKGVSPRDPVRISYWPSSVEIPAVNLKPLDEQNWEHATHRCTLGVLKKMPALALPLSAQPLSPDTLDCRVRHDQVVGDGEEEGYYCFHSIDVSLIELEGRPCASIDLEELVEVLDADGVSDLADLQIKVSYIAV